MSDTAAGSSNNKRMLKDTVIYMAAKLIEGIAGILTIFALQHLLEKSEMGRYSLWNITATTLAMLSIQWLSQSASRYLNDYEFRKDGVTFYSTVFSAWLKINAAALAVFTVFGIVFSRVSAHSIPGFLSFMTGEGFVEMICLAALYFVTYNTSQLLIALLSVKRKVYMNLAISVSSSVGKLVLILVLSRLIGAEIRVIFISYIICDFLVIIAALTALSAIKYIKPGCGSGALMGDFGRYGVPLVGNLATTTVLNNSDRYIIEHYMGEANVGLYSNSYSVVSAAFTMIQTALMRGSYPTILKTYAAGEQEQTEKLVSQAVRNYLLVAVPSVVGIGVLAKPLAELYFQKDYIPGYPVMVWVAAGMAFLGLTEYANKPWELSAKTGYIFRNSALGGTVNLLINIVFMPRFGYMTAAYSTFIGFFIYFCLSKLGSRKLMKWRVTLKTYLSVFGCAAAMGACLYMALLFIGITRLTLFIYVFAGVILYGALLALTGELGEELRMAKEFYSKSHFV